MESEAGGRSRAGSIPIPVGSARSQGLPMLGTSHHSHPRGSHADDEAGNGLFSMSGAIGSPMLGTPMSYLVRSGHLPHATAAQHGGSAAAGLTPSRASMGSIGPPSPPTDGTSVPWLVNKVSKGPDSASHSLRTELLPSAATSRPPSALLDPAYRQASATSSVGQEPWLPPLPSTSLHRQSSFSHQLQGSSYRPAPGTLLGASPQASMEAGLAGAMSVEHDSSHHIHRPQIGLVRTLSGGADRGAAARSSTDMQRSALQEPLLEGVESSEAAGAEPDAVPAGGYGGGEAGHARVLQTPSASRALALEGGASRKWEHDGGPLKAVVFGLINSAVGLPALIAFAAIVFKAPVYAPYLGSLCRFFFFASAVHQLAFVLLSSLPFAIGQVQDVGLIFLSAMATAVAAQCAEEQLGPQVTLGTSLLTMSVSTLIVGLLTVLVGRFRLAQLVQYVPLPVVGGYLGYVGYFCIAGGIALGCSTQIDTLASWTNLLTVDAAVKLIPTVGTALLLMWTMAHVPHPLALPAVLLAIPVAFFVVLACAGRTLQDAQDAGWVMQPPVGNLHNFWELWSLYNLQDGLKGIHWPALLAQAPKLAGLFLVVCFGSCMDVAAIQQDVPWPLEFNRELITVGISNCVVGLLGAGYTGSYIFSQTVFTMRASVFNRLNGLVVTVVELAVFVLPFSVVQYCPNFFFGALLLWFGVEISRDWLILSVKKLSLQEYLLLWLTFGCVMAFDLERGIALGVVAATLYFAYSYAKSQVTAVRVVPATSGSMHSYEVGALLDLLADRVVVCGLAGFIFFGSSISISDEIEQVASKMVSEVTASYHEAAQQVEAARKAPVAAADSPTTHTADSHGRAGPDLATLSAPAHLQHQQPTSPLKVDHADETERGVYTRLHPDPSQPPHRDPVQRVEQAPRSKGTLRLHASQQTATPAGGRAAEQEQAAGPQPIAASLRQLEHAGREAASLNWQGHETHGGAAADGGAPGRDTPHAASTGQSGVVTSAPQGGKEGPPGSPKEASPIPAIMGQSRGEEVQSGGSMQGSSEQVRNSATLLALADAPLFIVLNLRLVSNVDATGARTFSSLVNSLGSRGIHALFVGIKPTDTGLRRLLAAHGVVLHTPPHMSLPSLTPPQAGSTGEAHEAGADGVHHQKGADSTFGPPAGVCYEFDTVQSAMQYVEGCWLHLAVARGVLQQPAHQVRLAQLLQQHAEQVAVPADLVAKVVAGLGQYTRVVHAARGEVLLAAGQPVDQLMLVQQGLLQLQRAEVPAAQPHADHQAVAVDDPRSSLYGQGCWVLATDFFLRRPAPGNVTCAGGPCSVLTLSHSSYLRMLAEAPQALGLLQWALLRFSAMELSEARDRAERTAGL